MRIVLGGSCGVIGGPLGVHLDSYLFIFAGVVCCGFQKRPLFCGHHLVWRDGDGGHFEVSNKYHSGNHLVYQCYICISRRIPSLYI